MSTTDIRTTVSDTVEVRRARRTSNSRPGEASSPGAPTNHRGRRVGLFAGALIALFVLAGCNVPVQQWVPDFNSDGHIDAAEVEHQRAEIARKLADNLEQQRRAVQSHPFLSCVRAHESGGNYGAQNPSSSASGAYQFIDSTWRNVSVRSGHPGYATAAHAPWYVQDAVAMWLYNNGGRSAWAGTGC